MNKDRVSRVARYYVEHATSRPENRGGARNVEEKEMKRSTIEDHIETFKCRASHYGRRGAPGRKFLPCDLSVTKMHSLFQEQDHDDVSYSLYYTVFRNSFNLGFGHPVTDACADCVKYRLEIANGDQSEDDKKIKTAQFILHRRRARMFYDLLGDIRDDSITVCFDMMQNLVLPKTPIGQAYYSRQLYMYIFGVVVHRGKGCHQYKDDVHLYTWMEHENRKDSNVIASALDDFFRNIINDEISEKSALRLFSDSCYGQNKNMNVLSMLLALRKGVYPNLNISFTFPVRGHSFLPADRVFGRIEQNIRRKPTILLPEDYVDIMKDHGVVHKYGEDWSAKDFKEATKANVKQQRSFKLSEARVVEINSDQIGFKPSYTGASTLHNVLKTG